MSFNDSLINKSYLLEFTASGKESKSFVFSVPPQNESFERNQRINETKTFGGLVVDDYGNDAINITLSGSTINEEQRIVKLNGNDENKTGSEEITELENLIDEYGKIENLKGKKVYLYSLDNSKSNNYWQVNIKSFTTKRSKDNPLMYSYTLNCIGIRTDGKKISTENVSGKLETKTDKENLNTDKIPEITPSKLKTAFAALCKNILKGISFLNTALKKYQEFQEYVDEIMKGIDAVTNAVNSYTDMINSFVNVTSNYVKDVTRLGDKIISSAYRCTVGAVLSVYQNIANLTKTVNECVDWFRNLDKKFEGIGEQIEKGFGETKEDIVDTCNEIFGIMEDDANAMLSITKKQGGTVEILVIPGGDGEDDEVQPVYGSKPKTVEYADTWDNIAREYFGDPSMAKVIAMYNNNIPLETGARIYIPILEKQKLYVTDVYNLPGVKDNYGKDIRLTKDGDLDLDLGLGDFKTTTGIDTLNQAVMSRLMSDSRARIRLTAYGLITQIGDISLVNNYITAQIKETLTQDARIKSVDKIEFSGDGDNIRINVLYTDINESRNNFRGVL